MDQRIARAGRVGAKCKRTTRVEATSGRGSQTDEDEQLAETEFLHRLALALLTYLHAVLDAVLHLDVKNEHLHSVSTQLLLYKNYETSKITSSRLLIRFAAGLAGSHA